MNHWTLLSVFKEYISRFMNLRNIYFKVFSVLDAVFENEIYITYEVYDHVIKLHWKKIIYFSKIGKSIFACHFYKKHFQKGILI